MEQQDFQILRRAALELQVNDGDLVRVAGVVQSIKDWWASRKNRKALNELRVPIDQAFKDLETALRSQDAETVNRITQQELPALLRHSVKGVEQIREQMLGQHHGEYVGKGSERPLAGRNLSWVSKDYHKDKALIDQLWEMLPEPFRSEVPVGKYIGKPISGFSWYRQFTPDDIIISGNVKNNLWNSFSRHFTDIIDRMSPGYDAFLQNLKFTILNDSTLVSVNFSPVSDQVKKRYSNEMRVEVKPNIVPFPVAGMEIPIVVDKVILTDLQTRASSNIKELRMLGVWLSSSNRAYNISIPEQANASDGPITKIVKRALLKTVLPKTQAIIRVSGQTFEHKVQFARVLASALRQEIDAECSVRNKNEDIEIQAEIYGSQITVIPAIFGISKYLSDRFLRITKIGVDIDIDSGISGLPVIKSEILDSTFRKVAFDCWRIK